MSAHWFGVIDRTSARARPCRSRALRGGRAFTTWRATTAQPLVYLDSTGADILVGSGSLTREAPDALRTEARRRAQAGEFFGHISFVSVIARKPNNMNAA